MARAIRHHPIKLSNRRRRIDQGRRDLCVVVTRLRRLRLLPSRVVVHFVLAPALFEHGLASRPRS